MNLLRFFKEKNNRGLGIDTRENVCWGAGYVHAQHVHTPSLGITAKYICLVILTTSLEPSRFLEELKSLNFNTFQQPSIECLSWSKQDYARVGGWIKRTFYFKVLTILHTSIQGPKRKGKLSAMHTVITSQSIYVSICQKCKILSSTPTN